ncbi:ATP-binding protein [Geodermatophilus marinus]|uniref:ATP-binding protein n=1 Tax=Geodermatophilus sp. LHW52908 TaxID=2303986 RepID=UPI000E3EAC75|nr:sensor histidine kinase [Geodermatophilus sp. LHW52908]RFU18996.1 sensor histidine kinase [Geodermatophilus sp. LHW52908]
MLLLQLGVLVAVIALGFALTAWRLGAGLEHRFQENALDVARSVAAQPGLADEVLARDTGAIQRRALAVQRTTGALFVVVTDDQGIRLAHPDPARIGEPVSTSPDAVLRGAEVANIERGTLGLSARGKVPLRDGTGRIVGEVSVGFDANDISAARWQLVRDTAAFLGVALLLGAGGSMLLVRLLRRRTFGLEPADLAELVREREAVLFGISDGVLALDDDDTVSAANAEASRLLGVPIEPGSALADLDLPAPLARAVADRSGTPTVTVVGDRVLVVTRREVERGGRRLGSVVTVLDRTEVERLTDELGAVRLMAQALRAQRHEFANRLHTLHGLLHTGDADDAADYVRALLDSPAVALADNSEAIASSTVRAYLGGQVARAAELGVQLTVSEASWVPQRLLAPVEVITVLGNLVTNAVEAAHASRVRPARVEVDLLSDGMDLVISVANTGDGLPQERLAGLFAGGVSSRGEDRGFGLAIARGTAESLGGSIEVTHAGGDGALTVFASRLPGVLEEAEVPA